MSMSKAARAAASKARANALAKVKTKRTMGRGIAVASGGAAGFIEGRYGAKVPHIDALGVAGTYGAAAGIAGLALGSEELMDVGTGMLAAAAWNLGMEQGLQMKAKAEGGELGAMDIGAEGAWDDEEVILGGDELDDYED